MKKSFRVTHRILAGIVLADALLFATTAYASVSADATLQAAALIIRQTM